MVIYAEGYKQRAKYVVFSRSKRGYYFHTFNLARQQHFSQIENRPSMFFAQPFLC